MEQSVVGYSEVSYKMQNQSLLTAQTLINNALSNSIIKQFGNQPTSQGGLLNFIKSPYARDIATGLLAQSGYSPMPTSFGQTVGTAIRSADQSAMQRKANELAELTALGSISKAITRPDKDRKTAKGADGFLYYTDTGERVLPNVELLAKDRATAEDIKGILRYKDDGSQVFPDDIPEEKTFSTAKDINDQLRYTEGPNKGELVFPKVVKDEKDEERKTAKDIDGILRYVDNGEKVFSSDEAPEDKRETGKDIDGILRYTDTGEKVFPTDTVTKKYATAKDVNDELRYTEGPNIGERVFDVEKKEDKKERKTQTDINGVLRYVDDGKPVFPDVQKEADKRETKQDVNNQWRYTDTGELVFPKVTKQEEERKYERWQGFKDIAKNKFDIILTDSQAKLLDKSIGENVLQLDPESGILVNRMEELLSSWYPKKDITKQTAEDGINVEEKLKLGSEKLEEKFKNKQVIKLGEDFETQAFTEVIGVLEELGNLLPPEGEDIAGYGLTGPLPDRLLSSEGRAIRSAFSRLFNTTLKERSGVAVTEPELERLKNEFNTGKFKTDEDLRNALGRYQRILGRLINATLAKYPQEVVEQYQSQGGIITSDLERKKSKYGID